MSTFCVTVACLLVAKLSDRSCWLSNAPGPHGACPKCIWRLGDEKSPTDYRQDSFAFPISLVLMIYSLDSCAISTELSPSSIAYCITYAGPDISASTKFPLDVVATVVTDFEWLSYNLHGATLWLGTQFWLRTSTCRLDSGHAMVCFISAKHLISQDVSGRISSIEWCGPRWP